MFTENWKKDFISLILSTNFFAWETETIFATDTAWEMLILRDSQGTQNDLLEKVLFVRDSRGWIKITEEKNDLLHIHHIVYMSSFLIISEHNSILDYMQFKEMIIFRNKQTDKHTFHHNTGCPKKISSSSRSLIKSKSAAWHKEPLVTLTLPSTLDNPLVLATPY